ncbi:MAG: hypothetical protein NC213_10290 [Acetobacter sp.]|nr:hypothetical protein [Bacteroides sp.]MCM1342123.1 hypothetical protein [Acetobacter sp.]MCM1434342.1 hypothetical protein [Clostridiales bacterium]
MKVKISDIPKGKSFEDYPEDTEFIWDEKRTIYDVLYFTKDRILLNCSEYCIDEIIDYMLKNNLSEEDITIEELEQFRI